MILRLDLPTLNVRARGLGARLFPRAELEEMAGAPSVASLARELEVGGRLLLPIGRPPSVAAVESAVRYTIARQLRILSVWAGSGPPLDVFYADQDRHSLRVLLRGALQAAPPDVRLGGLLPTPCLPERALTVLARQSTPGQVVAQLALIRYPEVDRLSVPALRTQPVLLDLERALVGAFAERSLVAARAGDRNLVDFVRGRIDVCNVQMALAFTAGPRDVSAAALFTDGGASLARPAFLDACAATSTTDAADRMARALDGTALQSVVGKVGGDPVRLESEALRRALVDQRRRARLDPLGSAPVISFLLRLEAQSADLKRLVWGASLGAPAELVRPGLVTPWS